MANNLDVSMGIDTAKFRADAAIVKEELRKISAEVTKAAKGGDVQAVKTLTAEQDRLARQYATLNGQIRSATRATQENTAATYASSRSYREATRSVAEFAKSSGLGIEGMKALKFGLTGFITAEFIRGMKSALDQLNLLNSTAKAIRADPKQLKAMETSFKETGQAAELAAAMLGNFNKAYDAAALKQKLGQGGFGGAAVLKGGMGGGGILRGGAGGSGNLQDVQTVLRGGKQPSLEGLKDDPIGFILGRPLNLKNQIGDMKEVAARILAVKDATLQNVAAERVYGLTFQQVEKELRRQAADVTLPERESNAQYRARTGFDYGPRPGEMRPGAGGLLGLQPGVTAPLKATADTTEKVSGLAADQAKALEDYNKTTTAGEDLWRDINTSLGLTVVQAINSMKQLGDLSNILKGKPSTTTAPAGIMPGAETLGGNAAGGYIRGAGTGTSDSILARLSNGEFVVNAGSVRRLGTGFLNSLNSFASGGLIDLPRVGFASGGYVAASAESGRPVHLHLGNGHSFALGGPVSVVDALVTEAHAQQMRSAGTKPSWFAARPSGR